MGGRTWVFVCRWVQLLIGAGAVIAGGWTSAEYYESNSMTDALAAGAFCSAQVVLVGAIGFFAHARPHDVHWHLMLAVDIVGMVAAVVATGCDSVSVGLSCGWYFYDQCNGGLAGAILNAILVASTIPPIAVALRARRKDRFAPVAPAKSTQHDWFHMEEPQSVRDVESADGERSSGAK